MYYHKRGYDTLSFAVGPRHVMYPEYVFNFLFPWSHFPLPTLSRFCFLQFSFFLFPFLSFPYFARTYLQFDWSVSMNLFLPLFAVNNLTKFHALRVAQMEIDSILKIAYCHQDEGPASGNEKEGAVIDVKKPSCLLFHHFSVGGFLFGQALQAMERLPGTILWFGKLNNITLCYNESNLINIPLTTSDR